jgi:hypothetical protein
LHTSVYLRQREMKVQMSYIWILVLNVFDARSDPRR